MAENDEESMEALERAMNEMDALRAIYGGDESDHDEVTTEGKSSSFEILSPSARELNRIRNALGLYAEEDGCRDDGSDDAEESLVIPCHLQVRVQISLVVGDDNDHRETKRAVEIRFRLPKGYPERAAAVAYSIRVTPNGLARSLTDHHIRTLNEKAESLLGSESLLDLVEETRILLGWNTDSCETKHVEDEDGCCCCGPAPSDTRKDPNRRCRLWIWVHHITSKDRRKSILEEARERNLTGMLKHGYPGVVLVQGSPRDCESFVVWIKGNKSRPGGFGRNWGHHVRGQIEYSLEVDGDTTANNKNHSTFEELEELSEMARICKDMGLEDEFKEYVMQHR